MPQMRIMKSHYQQKTGPYLWLISIRARISCNFSYGNILCSGTFFLSSTKPDVRNCSTILYITLLHRRSQWPRGLRCGSDAARLLRLWVRIPPGTLMFVCCECCVLSGRGLSLRRADHSSRGVLTVVCRCGWSRNLVNEEPWPTGGCRAESKQTNSSTPDCSSGTLKRRANFTRTGYSVELTW